PRDGTRVCHGRGAFGIPARPCAHRSSALTSRVQLSTASQARRGIPSRVRTNDMLKEVSRVRLVGAWCAAVLVIGACGVVLGMPITLSYAGLLLVLCVVPPAVMLLVWGGARQQ